MFLALGTARRAAVLPHLVGFATGALLGAAFLGLVPHALDQFGDGGSHAIGLALLAGILTFFLLEKFVLWRDCHDDPCEMHSPSDAARDAASANLILAGDAFHNVLDGVLVAAAFMTDARLGIGSLRIIQRPKEGIPIRGFLMKVPLGPLGKLSSPSGAV